MLLRRSLPAKQPVKLRVLALVAPGPVMANVPIECLLEDSDVELTLCYAATDEGEGFYQGLAATEDHSRMNVVFRLPSAEREQAFLKEAAQEGFSGLGGHRSLDGIRASIYNAMPLPSVELLRAFMEDFCRRMG